MKAKILVYALLVLTLATIHLAAAQQPKVYFLGVLSLGSTTSSEIKGLRDGLKQAGYDEGKNLILNIGVAKNYDELRPIVQSYIEKKIDVIVSSGTSAPLIAKESTQHIPIVFIGAADPIQAGLVKSMARPESNLTGLARYGDVEFYGKRVEVFKEV